MNSNPHLSNELQTWLLAAIDQGASDLHLAVGHSPTIRLHGSLLPIRDQVLDSGQLTAAFDSLCDDELRQRILSTKQVDLSFEIEHGTVQRRCRANACFAGGEIAISIRIIPDRIPDLAWAGFPADVARRIVHLMNGLVIFTGSTGSGKTTSLAMIVKQISEAGGKRIITVEEPVEYLYPQSPNSFVTQREVGSDVLSFADGLKAGLRQDPDVILVGEIRDRATAQMALSAAETGHLVLTTLHTRDAKGAISRFADIFPQDVQQDVRYQLALSLRAVVAQRLLPAIDLFQQRNLALEVLWKNDPIAAAIRTSKLESIDNYLVTGRDQGMISFDESIANLFHAGRISREVAESNVRETNYLNRQFA